MFVVVEADTIVGPHAVMVHDKDTHVTNTAVMGSQRLHKLAFLAEGVLTFWKLSQSILESFKIVACNGRVPQYFGHIP